MRAFVLASAFTILWFVSFFLVLPIGIGPRDEALSKSEAFPHAPANPRLLIKAALATCAAVVMWGVFYALIAFGALEI